MKTITNLLISLILITTASCQESRTVKVTVTEEDGTPIQGATATVIFLGYGNDGKVEKAGLTDALGKFQASGTTSGRMHVRVEKDGYYETNSGRLSRKEDHDVSYILRKKINPVGLYARKIHLHFPKNRAWMSFDFEIGDWVKPFGKGLVSDISFRCDTEMTNEMDGKGTLEIKFKVNEGLQIVEEGILSLSEMKMPHLALEEGYVGEIFREEKSFRNTSSKLNVGYFFKTRAKVKDDKMIANYGKIIGDFRFDPRGNRWRKNEGNPASYAILSFTYYFNPNPDDRNLEFDPTKNLSENLDSVERVNEP